MRKLSSRRSSCSIAGICAFTLTSSLRLKPRDSPTIASGSSWFVGSCLPSLPMQVWSRPSLPRQPPRAPRRIDVALQPGYSWPHCDRGRGASYTGDRSTPAHRGQGAPGPGHTPNRFGIPAINFDQGTPIPRCFVVQLPEQLAPSHIGDGFGERWMLHHLLHGQRLHRDSFDFHESGVLSVGAGSPDDDQRCGHARLATLRRAFSRFFDPLCLRAWRRCSRASRFSSCAKNRWLPVFAPVEHVTTSSRPRSTPTMPGTGGKGAISSSSTRETK